MKFRPVANDTDDRSYELEVLILAAILGLIPAAIAQSKGRSFVGWWIYGALLFIIALPHALLASRDQAALDKRSLQNESVKKCPMCAELIRSEAKVCRFCGYHYETGSPVNIGPTRPSN